MSWKRCCKKCCRHKASPHGMKPCQSGPLLQGQHDRSSPTEQEVSCSPLASFEVIKYSHLYFLSELSPLHELTVKREEVAVEKTSPQDHWPSFSTWLFVLACFHFSLSVYCNSFCQQSLIANETTKTRNFFQKMVKTKTKQPCHKHSSDGRIVWLWLSDSGGNGSYLLLF